MARKRLTMTEALKKAITDSGMSHLDISRESGVQRASIIRFMRGTQSLRLDKADQLAEYLCIEIKRKGR